MALLPTFGFPQQISGKGSFPQYRSISGLPGGGFPVTRDGRINIQGHTAISTPIAFSVRPGTYVAALANLSPNKRLRSFDGDQSDGANGTLAEMFGFGTGLGHFTYSAMFLSERFDVAMNVHFQPRRGTFYAGKHHVPVHVGLGVQDLLSQGGSSGEGIDGENNGGKSNSPYVVFTAELPEGVYASTGIGVSRYRTLFANASMPLSDRFRLTGEFDGYGINVGVLAQLSPNLYASIALMDNRRMQWTTTVRLP